MAETSCAPPGLLTHLRDVARHRFPVQELRLATVLNGGVSLAVWMGGVTLEIDRLVKADPGDATSPYGAMLALSGCTARTDVISGTSAGGINGAALALAQANRRADLSLMREVWTDQGDIEKLLRRPFHGAPTSLLRGDDYFLPQLNAVLHRLAATTTDPTPPERAPLDLTITTTVLRGNQTVSVDAMGQELPQTLHAGRFVWRRGPAAATDPFDLEHLPVTAAQLALAARCTASFPVAFEPVFVPVGPGGDPLRPGGDPLRPDMAGAVHDWGDDVPRANRSRYVVDGGLLANTPTRPALEAIASMPAGGPVRRVMLLVYPHAGSPAGMDGTRADRPDRPPTLSGTVLGLLDALSSTGNRTFVEEIERHNRVAAGRRSSRAELLVDHPGPIAMEDLARCLFPQYRRLRRARTARDLATRTVERTRLTGSRPWSGQWNYDRIRHSLLAAQDTLEAHLTAEGPPASWPDLPTAGAPDRAAGWDWGAHTAGDVIDAVAEVLRRLAFVVPLADDELVQARCEITGLAQRVKDARARIDAAWEAAPPLADLEPTQSYWELWLSVYQRRMALDPADPEQGLALAGYQRAAIDRLATDAAVRRDLTDWVAAQPIGDVGAQIRDTVITALDRLAAVLATLPAATCSRGRSLDQDLTGWAALLTTADGPGTDALLTRLLHLTTVHGVVGDEADAENTQPLELVQLSAHTTNPLTEHSTSADDKLGGWSAHRFGGFLKRSWRVNDWTWGRIDAATMLSRTVLHPRHIRRAAELSGYFDRPGGPDERADATLAQVLALLPPGVAALAVRRSKAHEELRAVLDPAVPVGDLPASLPNLADLFAAALHLDIVPGELPALAAAIGADRLSGANPRCHGERFLVEHAELLHTVTTAGLPSGSERLAAYRAFDRAGIGREPWPDELSSDLMLRVATTAAAVGVTVADSPQSGLGAVRAATRTVRGVALLPYWGIQALTSRSQVARTLALLAFGVGGLLLALSLLGVLPAALAGTGTALGLGAVLAVVAFGALRTGTWLHSMVLLTPLFALIGYAATRIRQVAVTDRATAVWGLTSLGVILALCLGLMLLASLPAPSGSVAAALDRLAQRSGHPAPTPPPGWTGPPGSQPTGAHLLRWGRGILSGLRRAAPAMAVIGVMLAVGVGAVLLDERLRSALWVLGSWWYAAFVAGCALAGLRLATLRGRALQVLRTPPTGQPWRYDATHAAGAAAGWAVVYGVAYLILAAVLTLNPGGALDAPWSMALVAGVLALGAWFALIAPWLLPRRAVRRLVARELADARRNPGGLWRTATSVAGTAAGAPVTSTGASTGSWTDARVGAAAGAATPDQTYAAHLVARGAALRCWVSPPKDASGAPTLTPAGGRLFGQVLSAAGTPGEERRGPTAAIAVPPEDRKGSPPGTGGRPGSRPHSAQPRTEPGSTGLTSRAAPTEAGGADRVRIAGNGSRDGS